MRAKWSCIWNLRHIHNGLMIWQESVHNLLTTEGNKAITDVFMRASDTVYFPFTNFWVGLYRGSISKVTVLATIPGEPSGYGYARSVIERSSIGFPTMEIDGDGDWRAVSKEVTITAAGGSIGPIDGGFLGTSLNNTGSLIGVVATCVQRTMLAGDSLIIQLKVKIK
jgi:hypothetical protein